MPRRLIIENFIKETKETVLITKDHIEKEIINLAPLKIELPGDKIIFIHFKFVLSMIDGKVLAFITNIQILPQ